MMQRTVCLSLHPTPKQVAILLETSRQFTEAFNTVCQVAWAAGEKNGVRLHHLTYRSLKDRLPDLVSDLHIQARVKATEAIKSAFTRRQHGHRTSCPHSSRCSPRYNSHTFTVDWAAGKVNLATVNGRLVIPFLLPAVFAWARAGEVATAELLHRQGRFWLHVVITTTAPEVPPNDVVVGVDLGINQPAVTSDAQFLGQRRWKEVEARLFRQKRQCQAKRSKSAKRRLRILRGRQARFCRDCDHVLACRIVEDVPPGGTVVLENLTGIRNCVQARRKQRRRLHNWSFAQLGAFVRYKAEARGVRVVFTNPRHTSQTCSRCGHQHRSNRRSQSLFQCRACGFTINADLNAARNIRAKHLAGLGTPSTGRPLSTGPTRLTAQCGGASAATCKPSPPGDGR